MISRFLEYLNLERNFSSHTIKNYKIDLTSFQVYLDDNKNNLKIQEVKSRDIREYIVYLSERKYSEKTINRKISAIKSFFKFLKKIDHKEYSSLIDVRSPKIPKKVHTVISEVELDKLLSNNDFFTEDFKGQRNKTIIEIFYTTGIRKSELIQLNMSNLNFYQNTIKVLGKRNKERIIPIAEKLANQIKKYLSYRAEIIIEPKEENVFISQKGKKLSEKTVYDIVNNHLKLVSVKQKKSPHILRHSFATHLLNNGADITAIKELLGHTSLASTQVYTSASINKLKEVFNQSHPRGLKSLNYDN